METGIFIRAFIALRPESVDIGDRRLSAEQLLRWLAGLKDDQILVTMDKVRAAIEAAAEESVAKPRGTAAADEPSRD
jgi:hypothetical protein